MDVKLLVKATETALRPTPMYIASAAENCMAADVCENKVGLGPSGDLSEIIDI
jgi:hypothetical protein